MLSLCVANVNQIWAEIISKHSPLLFVIPFINFVFALHISNKIILKIL